MSRFLQAAFVLLVTASLASAGGKSGGGSSGGKSVPVSSYTRKDGTQVQAHTRAAPGARTTARTDAPADPPTSARASARGESTPESAALTDAPDPAPPAPVKSSPVKKPEVAATPNGKIVPKQAGAAVFPVPAGKQAFYVERYEAASADGRKSAAYKLVSDDNVVLIDAVTPVANEAIHNGWIFCRPTEGPHTRRALVVREEYYVPNAAPR